MVAILCGNLRHLLGSPPPPCSGFVNPCWAAVKEAGEKKHHALSFTTFAVISSTLFYISLLVQPLSNLFSISWQLQLRTLHHVHLLSYALLPQQAPNPLPLTSRSQTREDQILPPRPYVWHPDLVNLSSAYHCDTQVDCGAPSIELWAPLELPLFGKTND